MKLCIYYGIALGAQIAATVIFHRWLNITYFSLVPMILAALMGFQAYLFFAERQEDGFHTNYGSDMTAHEKNQNGYYVGCSLLVCLPLEFPFVLFFPSGWKMISLAVYALGLISGGVVFRAKHSRDIEERLEAEDRALEEQKERESRGRWK